jgi:hypothetical protein
MVVTDLTSYKLIIVLILFFSSIRHILIATDFLVHFSVYLMNQAPILID